MLKRSLTLSQEIYHRLISGRSTGLGPMLLRFFLSIAAWVYSVIIRLRNFLYSRGWLKTYRVNAVIFSIGNITVGGTGKTPLVIWLYGYINHKSKIKNQNCGVSILTRGYKTRRASCVMRCAKDERNTQYAIRGANIDEPAILAQSCPQARVIVNPDRVVGAAEAFDKFGAKILIMDDGFQHRRLARDLDIVTIDAMRPFGYGKLFPAGLLREPVASLKRADAAIITRCDQVLESELNQIENALQAINSDMIIARSMHSPICAKTIGDKEIGLEGLRDKKIFAFCGIGNPDGFLKTIKKFNSNLVGSKIYNDHYRYTEKDISVICEKAKKLKADLILTTQKDWNRLPIENRKSKIDIPFAYLAIELKFVSGEDKITQLIESALAGKIHQK